MSDTVWTKKEREKAANQVWVAFFKNGGARGYHNYVKTLQCEVNALRKAIEQTLPYINEMKPESYGLVARVLHAVLAKTDTETKR